MFPIALVAASLQITLVCKVVSCTPPAAFMSFDPTSSLIFSELEEVITFTNMFRGVTVSTHWTACGCGVGGKLTGTRRSYLDFRGGHLGSLATMEFSCSSEWVRGWWPWSDRLKGSLPSGLAAGFLL